jgi:hypothetical protein
VLGHPFIGSEGSRMAGQERESSRRTVWQWRWSSGAIPPAVLALNEGGEGGDEWGGEAARAASTSGRRGGGQGSSRVWWHTGAQARGGGLLKEGEREGVGVGRADREANA